MVGQLRLAQAAWGPVRSGSVVRTETFALPAGTATFLSAEVVPADREREVGGDEVANAMGRIEAVVTPAVGRYGGIRQVGRREPGSVTAAFARASEAVVCALEVQRALEAQGLPCLRMGVSTGEAQLHGEVRHFGQAVGRAARLRDLAHGGQVLLSRAAADLVADHLPPGASLEDLGTNRMRDLGRPEQVYQLAHPDLRSGFPPLRSLDRYAHNLPVQLTNFVGREAAVAEVVRLMVDHGLVTLTGSGGCGKTRLALQVAAEALGPWPEAWFVDLSGLADPALVSAAVLAAMGVKEVPDQSHVDTLTSWLATRAALIVLDNCEHVVAAASALAVVLVQRCGRLVVLATSREPLGVAGEVVWRVPCLSLPGEVVPADIEALDASEAVQLFRDRARAARSNFAITDDNAPAVAAICQRLDGIPLAIELAAARVRMMSAERVAEALAERFHLLTGGTRSAVPRQQTLRASVNWSYELLSEAERALLRRLSVFTGGLTLDAAESVGASDEQDRYEVLGLLAALVDKSLVQVNDMGDRYHMLETVRAYAAEQLALAGEEHATRDRHLCFMADLAEVAEKGMWTSATASWLGLLDAEHDNLRAALDWSLSSGQFDTGARLTYAIGQYLYIRCFRTEGRRRCEEFLAQDLSQPRRAELYWWAAGLALYSDPSATLRYGQALVSLGRELGDDVAIARGLVQVACVQQFSDPASGLRTLEEALPTARAVGDGISVVDCLCLSASAYANVGCPRDALRYAEEALAALGSIDDTWGGGFATAFVAEAASELGELDRASEAAAALMELAENLDEQFFRQQAHWSLGVVAMYRCGPSAGGELAVARELAQRNHDDLHLAGILYAQGCLALALGQQEAGCRALEAVVPIADTFQPVTGIRARCILAEASVRRGELAEARRWLDAGLTLPLADQLVLVTRAQARLALVRGDLLRASELAADGLGSARRSGEQLLVVDFLELLAVIATDRERYAEAGRLFAAAAKERERLGYARFAIDQPDVDVAMAKLEVALGTSRLTTARSEGTALSLDEVVDYALRGRGRRGRPSAGWASLTPTERRVVHLVVEGLTNAEIGAGMFVSTATVKSHLTHIFTKLGVSNRRQLAGAARTVIA